MDEELDNIEQAREREHYSLDPRDQPFAADPAEYFESLEESDPDDESWRDEPEAEQDDDEVRVAGLTANEHREAAAALRRTGARMILGVTVGGRDAAIAAADAKMRELTAMPADVQKAVDDGVWEEA